MAATEVGDHFEITGPANRWYSGVNGGWQPRVWTSFPGDWGSELVRASDFAVDFGAIFQAHDIRRSDRFVSARIRVWGRLSRGGTGLRELWLNVAKWNRRSADWEDWVRVVVRADLCACGRCRREWLERGWICHGSPDAAAAISSPAYYRGAQ